MFRIHEFHFEVLDASEVRLIPPMADLNTTKRQLSKRKRLRHDYDSNSGGSSDERATEKLQEEEEESL